MEREKVNAWKDFGETGGRVNTTCGDPIGASLRGVGKSPQEVFFVAKSAAGKGWGRELDLKSLRKRCQRAAGEITRAVQGTEGKKKEDQGIVSNGVKRYHRISRPGELGHHLAKGYTVGLPVRNANVEARTQLKRRRTVFTQGPKNAIEKTCRCAGKGWEPRARKKRCENPRGNQERCGKTVWRLGTSRLAVLGEEKVSWLASSDNATSLEETRKESEGNR